MSEPAIKSSAATGATKTTKSWANWFAWACVAGAVAFVLLGVGARYDGKTGFTSLIRFGEFFRETRIEELRELPLAVAPNAGYDGQFYAQLAVNPDVRAENVRQAMDVAPYRARRILMPAIAHALGFGDAWRTLQIYALLNVAAWFALAFVWWREVRGAINAHNANKEGKGNGSLFAAAAWLACMLGLGALDSVRMALTDLPALLLLVIAVRAGRRNQNWIAGVCFAAAGFVKETSLFAVFSLRPAKAESANDANKTDRRNFWRIWIWRAAWVAPVAVWCLWLRYAIPAVSGGENAGTGVSGNFDWPGFALARHLMMCVREVCGGNFDSRYVFGFIGAVCLGYQSVYVLRRWREAAANPWVRVALPFAILYWLLGDLVWHGYWAAARACLPLTFAFNRLLIDEQKNVGSDAKGVIKLAGGNLYILHSVWRFFPF